MEDVVVHCLLDLSDSHLILPWQRTLAVIIGEGCIALGIGAHEAIVLNLELVVEGDFAVDPLDDVVLDQDQPIDLDVDGEPLRVEAGTDLLIDLDENVIRRLFNRSLAVLLRDRVHKFELVEANSLTEVVEGAGVQFLGLGVDQVLEALGVGELDEAEVDDFVDELVDQYKVGS